MSKSGESTPKKRLTKRQRQREILERMGQKTPEQQVVDLQRIWFANWMRRQNRGEPPEQ
jgi:hypothetical protein